MFVRYTTPIIDDLDAKTIGPDLYDNIAEQVALNALGHAALREDYASSPRPQDRDVSLALRFAVYSEACTAPATYSPSSTGERVYLLPWAV